MAAKKRNMSAKAVAVRKAHAAKVHASPEWAAKKSKVKAAHASKAKAQAGVKRATGSGGPSGSPKGFAPSAPPIGRTSPGTGGAGTSPAGSANIARQGAVTGAVKRMGTGTSKGVKYKKPTGKKIKV